MKITKSTDHNGNTTAKIKLEGLRAFSVQTNGNLPKLHRAFSGMPDGFRQTTTAQKLEVAIHVRAYGTPAQYSATLREGLNPSTLHA